METHEEFVVPSSGLLEPATTRTKHYVGAAGREFLVRVEDEARRWVEHYLYDASRQYSFSAKLVRIVEADGSVRRYEGPSNFERLVAISLPNNDVEHYEGGGRNLSRSRDGLWGARKVHVVLARGGIDHYKGGAGAERRVRHVRPTGAVEHYEDEVLRRVVLTDGSVEHYDKNGGFTAKVGRPKRDDFWSRWMVNQDGKPEDWSWLDL